MKSNTSPNKKCFSYIRYSSLGNQTKGTSEQRQLEIAPRIAKEKGWILDDTFSASDLGVSGYKGDNVKTIRSIIAKANSGIIPQGTVCILEALDRATRLILDDAYQLIRDLLKSGIEIYIDKTNRHLTKDDLNKTMSVMITVVELDAGFQYSDKLSERVKAAWQIKRNNPNGGKITKQGRLTKVCPKWINPETHEIIPAKAKIVKRIFKMYLEGTSLTGIAKILNGEHISTFRYAEHWDTPYIKMLLLNPIVIGEFQPKIKQSPQKRIAVGSRIKGYYKPIISQVDFYKVQDMYNKTFKKRTRTTGQCKNLFAGIAKCKLCGLPMNKIQTKYHNYLYCRGVCINTGCKAPALDYDKLENSFMNYLGQMKTLFNKSNGVVNNSPAIQAKIENSKEQVKNITNAIIIGLATKALVQKQSELEKEIEELELELNIVKSTQNVNVSFDETKYRHVMSNLETFKTDIEFRNQIRNWLISTNTEIIVDTKNKQFNIMKNGEFKMGCWIDKTKKQLLDELNSKSKVS